ncbi:hypothetical protein [uncultured Anaerobiospirillum sp.]|uniref:hypothetical protein n=1 Tax=uncultured Anaerobiospirillum sp. TaxID=265728 RepID=UPI0028042749|nr:hypothetical protein [uncultured Anaerobiospirillum sp.]
MLLAYQCLVNRIDYKDAHSEDALTQLKSASAPLKATDSDTTPAATAPHHYSVHISPQHALVAAIDAGCSDGSYQQVYRSDKQDDMCSM